MQPKVARGSLTVLFLLAIANLSAQQIEQPSGPAAMQVILQRIDNLEEQNHKLAQEIQDLRRQLALSQQASDSPAAAPLEDRVAVVENRVAEHAQTKVEASQKLPISITGEILFNAFTSAGSHESLPAATYSPFLSATNTSGATVRQTMLGFDFRGPSLPGDGKLNASLMMDFYSGAPSEQDDWVRIRTAAVSLDWQRRSVSFLIDKPLISPRQPSSLAEVSIPPLADAGNLWLWLPQLRYEERFKLGSRAGITAQAALMQTDETYEYVPSAFSYSLEKSRPAAEGRLGYWQIWNDRQRLEVAAGFHTSTSHVAETSAASHIFSVDWLATPFSKLEISGTFFRGENFSALGALSPGFSVSGSGVVVPVHGAGGWTQFSSPLTRRLTLNLFAGFQNNRPADLQNGNVVGNLSYAGNLMFHLSSNVVLSFESLQMRSRMKLDGNLIQNRYDLALAYLF